MSKIVKNKLNKYGCDIFTVTYNSSETILSFLKSLENNWKYINTVFILENNSPDKHKTEYLVKQYIANNKKLSYKIFFKLQSENFGFARSCNESLKLGHSPYILFLNPDAQLKSNSLEIMISHAINGEADIVGGLVEDYHGNTQYTAVYKPGFIVGIFEFTNLGKLLNISIGKRKFYPQSQINFSIENDIEVDAVSGAYLLIKRKSFVKLMGFDERFFMYLEDVDLGVRAISQKMRVLFCPHSSILHIGGFSSKNKYKIHHKAWFESRKYFYKKHYGFFINLVLQPVFYIEEKLLYLRLKLLNI